VLYRKFAELAENRGRTKAWGLLAFGAWFAGEMVGFVAGIVAGLRGLALYPVGIAFGAVATFIAYQAVKSLPSTWVRA
jgi:hypothetical protein